MWLSNGADSAALIPAIKLKELRPSLHELYKSSVDLNLDKYDDDDFVPFREFIDPIAVAINVDNSKKVVHKFPIALPTCCSNPGCRIHSIECTFQKIPTETTIPDYHLKEHRLDVVYYQMLLENNGRMKIKDTPSILQRAGITYDTKRLNDSFWEMDGEILIDSAKKFEEISALIRTDKDKDKDEVIALIYC